MMTPEQIAAIRAVPLGAMPNKLAIVFAVTGTTQTEVCKALGITNVRMSRLVKGQSRPASVYEAGQIARFFGCGIDDIFPLALEQGAA